MYRYALVVKGPILEISVGPKGGTHIYQTFLAYPVDMLQMSDLEIPL